MAQRSPAYAVGRVRVLEQSLLSRAVLERMVAAQGVPEAMRILSEAGWGDARTAGEARRVAAERVARAAELMRACSSDPDATDPFLIGYDILNIKTLIKSRALGESVPALSRSGVIDPEKLRRCVEENNYFGLPEAIRQGCECVEKRVAVQMDPLFVDAELDRAMQRYIDERLRGTKEEAVKRYFVCRAELTNLLIALRSAASGGGAALAGKLLLPGGTVPADKFLRVAENPDLAFDAVRARPYAVQLRQVLHLEGEERLIGLERAMDDYLLSLFRPHRYEPTSVLPLIGYFLARQREASAVRLILQAKASKVSEEKLQLRLRALY